MIDWLAEDGIGLFVPTIAQVWSKTETARRDVSIKSVQNNATLVASFPQSRRATLNLTNQKR